MLSIIKFHRYLSWVAGFWMLWMLISGLFLQHKKLYFSTIYQIDMPSKLIETEDFMSVISFLGDGEKKRVERPRDEQPFWMVRGLHGEVSCYHPLSYEKISSTPYFFYRNIRSLHQKLNLGEYGKGLQGFFVVLSFLLIGSGVWSGFRNRFCSWHGKIGFVICFPFVWVLSTGSGFFIKDFYVVQSLFKKKTVEISSLPKTISRIDYKKQLIRFRYQEPSDPHPIGSGRGVMQEGVIYVQVSDDNFLNTVSTRLMQLHTGWGHDFFLIYRMIMLMTLFCLFFLLKKIF